MQWNKWIEALERPLTKQNYWRFSVRERLTSSWTQRVNESKWLGKIGAHLNHLKLESRIRKNGNKKWKCPQRTCIKYWNEIEARTRY